LCDPNQLKAMQQLRYSVARCCSTCKHATWHVATPWGNCREATYAHQKHPEVTRQLPCHNFLCCDNYEFDHRVIASFSDEYLRAILHGSTQ
jgi:hypothetical protein